MSPELRKLQRKRQSGGCVYGDEKAGTEETREDWMIATSGSDDDGGKEGWNEEMKEGSAS